MNDFCCVYKCVQGKYFLTDEYYDDILCVNKDGVVGTDKCIAFVYSLDELIDYVLNDGATSEQLMDVINDYNNKNFL